ncbi:Gfo/Idh/MocA family protein [Maribacter sp. 2307ULW6-5]|uniref:Gfo/Idh/MocA family protein n=1 Tax=Maribacter sp. 2307ULW6-5 TaxID=3386275 RepID=UPI0039BCD8DB
MIRWGIAGTGKIAHSFANDLALCDGNKLMAVGSRSQERADLFGKEFKVPHCYPGYDALFESKEVDVVYVATPHTFHKTMSIGAIRGGKHVLCEKPLGMNVEEVKEMLAVAKENNVFLMEALWSRFNPAIRRAMELVEQGTIGTIGHLYADFAFFALDRDERGRLLNPDLGGGSLLDIGIYPIFLSYLFLGMPKEILATSKFHGTGAEIQTAMTFVYPEAFASLYSGLSSHSKMEAIIGGSKGTLCIKPRWHEATALELYLNGEKQEIGATKRGRGYVHEILEVQRCLQNGKVQSNLWTHDNSLELCTLLDKVRKMAGIEFPEA